MSFVNLAYTDQNDDGDLDRFNADSVNGSDITASWPGDTVTINVPGVGDVTYTGTTFYLANGQRVFTPTDGSVLQNGTFVSATFVTGQGSTTLPSLGVPCYTRGTEIDTPHGVVPVENLRVGDYVVTADHGHQRVRWTGHRTVAGNRDLAPIRLETGRVGNTRPLEVSPCHGIILGSCQTELLFARREVLARAGHLIDGIEVTRVRVPEVQYFHLLFDRHEIIFANGAPTESFFPGDWVLGQDPRLATELKGLAEELGFEMWKSARPVLRRAEAQALVQSCVQRDAGFPRMIAAE